MTDTYDELMKGALTLVTLLGKKEFKKALKAHPDLMRDFESGVASMRKGVDGLYSEKATKRDRSPTREKKKKPTSPKVEEQKEEDIEHLGACQCNDPDGPRRTCSGCKEKSCPACSFVYEDEVLEITSCKKCLILQAEPVAIKWEPPKGCGSVYYECALDASLADAENRRPDPNGEGY